jgi:hypothetical protein
MERLRLLIAFLLLGVTSALGQWQIGDRSFYVPSSGTAGTFSLVQANSCSVSGTTCTMTGSSNLGSGNYTVWACTTGNAEEYPSITITSITNAGGTLQIAPGASTGGNVNANMTGLEAVIYYILPNTATGGSGVPVINLSASGANTCYFQEWHPSCCASAVGLDIDGNLSQSSAASATSLTPSITGTNDVAFQMWLDMTAWYYPTSVTSPYNTESFFPGSLSGYAGAAVSTGTSATWTLNSSSALGTMPMLYVGFNPSHATEGGFEGFSGGASGKTPTETDLAAGMKGWQGCYWSGTSPTMTYSSSAGFGLLQSTGRLYGDGSTVAAGSGSSMGLAETWNGSTRNVGLQCNFFYGVTGLNFTFGHWYYDPFPATDTSSVDCDQIRNPTDYAAGNCYGDGASRFIRLEALAGNGGAIYTNPQSWYFIELTYRGGSGAIGASSVNTSVSGNTITWNGSFTPSQWPVNFGFSPSGCSSGSNYNGDLFIVTAVTSKTLTTSTNGYVNGGTIATASGSATGCTLTGQHQLLVYNSSGSLVGASFSAGQTTPYYPYYIFIGDANAGNTPTAGYTSYWASLRWDVTGAPVTF